MFLLQILPVEKRAVPGDSKLIEILGSQFQKIKIIATCQFRDFPDVIVLVPALALLPVTSRRQFALFSVNREDVSKWKNIT